MNKKFIVTLVFEDFYTTIILFLHSCDLDSLMKVTVSGIQ